MNLLQSFLQVLVYEKKYYLDVYLDNCALDPNKAHGHDMISIRMLKICGYSIYKPLQLIFRSCIENEKFPSEWKKANVVLVHKKGNKQTLEN